MFLLSAAIVVVSVMRSFAPVKRVGH
jgi:hypothetical protein